MIEIKNRAGKILHQVEADTLDGADLKNLDLEGAVILGHTLDRVDLTGANLRDAYIHGLKLGGPAPVGPSMRGAILVGADLTGADLYNANLENADLRRAILVNTRLHRAYLQGANFEGAQLSGTALHWADLTGVDLRRIILARAEFVGAKLVDARLQGLNFNGSQLNAADLSGANLERAELPSLLSGCKLQGSMLNHSKLRNAQLAGTDLTSASLWNADLSQADLSKSTLQRVVLYGANLTGTRLPGADLSEANLSFSSLVFADLTGARLARADLTNARLSRANLEGTDFQGAVFFHTTFSFCPTLKAARNLDQIEHSGPSSLDVTTLRAGITDLPRVFLRGIGLSNQDIQRLEEPKPRVYTEGKTDVSYVQTALELLGHYDLLAGLEIDEVGKADSEGTKGGGHKNLDAVRRFLENKQTSFPVRVLFLYDCDTDKKPEDIGPISVRSVPRNPQNAKVTKGMESLLPPELFCEQFYQKRTKKGEYGEENTISKFRKIEFCEWVCRQRRMREDFLQFDLLLVPLLREFLAPPTKA